jgi:hypothetical protein
VHFESEEGFAATAVRLCIQSPETSLISECRRDRDSSVSIVRRLRAERPRNQGFVLDRGKRLYFLRSVQWVAGTYFMGVKRPMRKTNHTFLFYTEIKNEWSCTSTPMSSWCSDLLSTGTNLPLPRTVYTITVSSFGAHLFIFPSYLFKIQFLCTVVGKPARWCHCCVTHAIGSRDMPTVHMTFHFSSNTSCGLLKNIVLFAALRSFDC